MDSWRRHSNLDCFVIFQNPHYNRVTDRYWQLLWAQAGASGVRYSSFQMSTNLYDEKFLPNADESEI